MQMSASVLGKEFGLTGQEMNRVFVKYGFLEGEPGNYTPTEKAKEFLVERDNHRGNGGYSWYNRNWTTRTFDDSILNVIDIDDELIEEVRSELTEFRIAKKEARLANEVTVADLVQKAAHDAEAASEDTVEEVVADTTENGNSINQEVATSALKDVEIIKKAGKFGLIAFAASAGIYFLYKLVKKHPDGKKKDNTESPEGPGDESPVESGNE